ncbi:hypothetical protein L7F22_002488 [Adiantum nelumboides]|nr:hypothetical protein [Adiantum nelumboides]
MSARRPACHAGRLAPRQQGEKEVLNGMTRAQSSSAMRQLPLIGGHEGAGVVVQLGPGADEYVKVGDRVGIKWLADSCLKCDQCRRGHEPNCSQAQCSGFTMDGSFQQYAIASARHLTPIPDSLDLETASPLLCAGVTVYRAVKEARLTPGETVAIVGAGGGLGHLAVQYAVNAGYRVIAIDSGAEKEKLARSLGAEAFVDFAKEKDLVQAVKDTTADKQGPSAAIVAASGGKAYEQALDYLRPAAPSWPSDFLPTPTSRPTSSSPSSRPSTLSAATWATARTPSRVLTLPAAARSRSSTRPSA